MEKFIDKLTSYNLFNNLLPGAVFAVFVKSVGETQLLYGNILINLFVFYFLGVIIGRIGSIVVEESAKKLKIVKYVDYLDFIVASDKDKKIETLLEMNNMYRTFIALFLIIGITELYKRLLDYCTFFYKINSYIVLVILILLFVLAFRKQTRYICNRVQKRCKDSLT